MQKIIIYDANCKFCTSFANWCIKKQNEFSIIPVRERDAKEKLKSVGIQFIDLQTIYFIDGKNVDIRSRAIFKILSFVNFPWKLITLLKYLPVKMTDWFYKLFAKYRR